MLVKTEVHEDEGDIGDLFGFGGGGPELESEPERNPELKRERPEEEEFIPSRVRPRLDARLQKEDDGGEEGVAILRCPKCSITYRSHASMKNHTAVCKAGKDPDAGAFDFCIYMYF